MSNDRNGQQNCPGDTLPILIKSNVRSTRSRAALPLLFQRHLTLFITGMICFAFGILNVNGNSFQGQEPVWKSSPEQIKIDDHLSFIFHRDRTSEITIIRILVKGGKASVPLSLRGTAFIATRLSNELPTGNDIRKLMHLGSTVTSQTHTEYSTIVIKSLTENLEETLKIVTKALKKPLLSGLRISNLKRFLKFHQKRTEDSPEQLMLQTYLTAFSGSGEYSLGGNTFGNRDSRKKIKRKHIQEFYRSRFTGNGLVLAVSSNLEKDRMTSIMQKYFSDFPPGEPLKPPTVPTGLPVEKKIRLEKDNQQVLISFGFLLPGVDRDNLVHIYMLENLLGKGIGSRLWALRSGKELAYSLTSRLIRMREAGLLIIQLKADKAKKSEAYDALKKLLLEFHQGGVTAEELEITKVRSRADFLRSCETKVQRTDQLAYFESLGVGFKFLEDFFSIAEKTTAADLNRYVKEFLHPDKMVEVIIGPTD